MKVECPRCHTHVEKPLHGDPVCPTCGFGAHAGGASGAAAGASAASPAGRGGLTPLPGASGATGSGQGASTSPDAGPAGAWPAGGTWSDGSGGPGWQASPFGAPATPKQGLAITSLVLGIVGCCIPGWGALLGIAAIVTGAIQLKNIKANSQEYGGRGLALAGLILGIIAVVVGFVVLLLMFAMTSILWDAFGCDEDPDQDVCQELDEPSDALRAGVVWPVAAIMPASARRWPGRHAG